MKQKTQRFASAFFIMLISLAFQSGIAQTNEKPFVIPELQEWKGSTGTLIPGKNASIILTNDNPQLRKNVETFVEDYHIMTGKKLSVKNGKGKQGDFVFALSNDKQLGDEGYTIQIDNQITITAQTPLGAFWATRTLLQIGEQNPNNALPKGFIND